MAILGESSSTKYTVRTTVAVADHDTPAPPGWTDTITLEGVVIIGEPNGCDTDTARKENALKKQVESAAPGEDWAVFRRGEPRVHKIFIRVAVPYSYEKSGRQHVTLLQVTRRNIDAAVGVGGIAVPQSAWDKMASHILSAFYEDRQVPRHFLSSGGQWSGEK